MSKKDPEHQTQFVQESPLWQERESLLDPDAEPALVKPWYRRPKTLVMAGVATLFLIIALFWLFGTSRIDQEAEPMPEEILEEIELSPEQEPLMEELIQLRQQLLHSDPSQRRGEAFPPIDLDLRLE